MGRLTKVDEDGNVFFHLGDFDVNVNWLVAHKQWAIFEQIAGILACYEILAERYKNNQIANQMSALMKVLMNDKNDKQETTEACNERAFDYDTANKISEFLQNSGYENASKAIDCEYNL